MLNAVGGPGPAISVRSPSGQASWSCPSARGTVLLASYGGDSALTALHFSPDPTGSAHGCVRVPAAVTEPLAELPLGTAITVT
ncbi:hypothetical protein [Frigoribacterium salinisoli]